MTDGENMDSVCFIMEVYHVIILIQSHIIIYKNIQIDTDLDDKWEKSSEIEIDLVWE